MRMKRAILVVGAAVALASSVQVIRADHDDDRNLRATPFAFIGTADGCGTPDGSHIVTAAWLGGMGLPDNGGLNTTLSDLDSNPNKNDPHRGLLLSKNGPTPDCSAPGATIDGLKPTTISQLGYDYRNGTACGAGAPRFNIESDLGFTYFAGCAAGTASPAPQDPAQWTRIRIDTAAQVFPASGAAPPFVFGPGGTRVRRIDIIFDEGTDTVTPGNPSGVGLVVIDNITINAKVIRAGRGVADGTPQERDDNDHHDR